MFSVYRKELKLQWSNVIGLATVACLLACSGFFFTFGNLGDGYGDFIYTLEPMKWILVPAIPLLSIHFRSSKQQAYTNRWLCSLPLRLRDVVLGRFFSSLTVFLLPTIVMALYPLLMSSMGNETVSLAAAYTALFGYVLMGASLIALCTLLATALDNQILAGSLGALICLVCRLLDLRSDLIPAAPIVSLLLCALACLAVGALVWKLSKNLTVGILGALVFLLPTVLLFFIRREWFKLLIPRFLDSVNAFTRVVGFFYGYFDIGATLFYLVCIVACLFLSVQALEARRRL